MAERVPPPLYRTRWANYLYVQDELVNIRKPVDNGKLGPPRICVPRDLHTDLIHKAHKGHLGLVETLNKIRNRSYFPNMEEHVTQIINNCIPCLQKSNIAPVTQTILQHRELLSYPLQRIYLDTVGPLTSSRFQGKTCKQVLTILDGLQDI